MLYKKKLMFKQELKLRFYYYYNVNLNEFIFIIYVAFEPRNQ